METTFSTGDAANPERFAYWREAICDAYVHLGCETDVPDGFHGEIVLRQIGPVAVSQVASDAQHVVRRPKDISLASDDYFLLSVQQSGTGRVVQHQRQAVLRPGDFALYSSSEPYELIFNQPFRQVVIQIPKSALCDRLPIADAVTAMAVDASIGAGRFASRCLRTVAANSGSVGESRTMTVADDVIDMVAEGLSSIASGHSISLKRQDRLTMLRVESFIASNLSDPTLDRAAVASAVGLSVRRINELLAEKGSSITGRIREARLEQVYRDLSEPVPGKTRVSDLAYKWGFQNMQHFSRLFRARYGLPPRDLLRGGTSH